MGPWLETYDGPVEQHPATARLRAEIAHLEAFPQTPERDEALEYCQRQVRRFEWGEYDSRARMMLAFMREDEAP